MFSRVNPCNLVVNTFRNDYIYVFYILIYMQYIYPRDLTEVEIVELRDIPKEQAKKEIISFIKGKERVWADELADALRLDLTFAQDILKELWEEGYVEPD